MKKKDALCEASKLLKIVGCSLNSLRLLDCLKRIVAVVGIAAVVCSALCAAASCVQKGGSGL